MENSRNEEIDLTLDDDSQPIQCGEKSDSDIDIDVERDEINIKEKYDVCTNAFEDQHLRTLRNREDFQSKENTAEKPKDETSQENIIKLLEHQEKLKSGQCIHIFSSGPFQHQGDEICRPINCHACNVTKFELNDMYNHIKTEQHILNVSKLFPEKKYQTVYNLYDDTPKEFRIMICMFAGENIAEVYEEKKNKLVYFCKSTNKLKLQKIVLNRTKKDILIDIDKKPILGLEYCIKFTNNYSYYCVLCDEYSFEDPILHFSGRLHVNNYTVRHFLLTRNNITTVLKIEMSAEKNVNALIEEIILQIYQRIEKKYSVRQINVIDQNMFNCFKYHYIKIICNNRHYSDRHVSKCVLKTLLNEYVQKNKEMKKSMNELGDYEYDSSNELVVINDKEDNEPSKLRDNFGSSDQEDKVSLKSGNESNIEIKEHVENKSTISDVEAVEGDIARTDSNVSFQFNEESAEIKLSEESFSKIKPDNSVELFVDPIANEDAHIFWQKATFSLEYIVRLKYYENNQEYFKFKCTLCNKYLTNLVVSHGTLQTHRMAYINKHFPILKSYLEACLCKMLLAKVEKDVAIGQMIAEICQRLKKRTNICSNKFLRINFKKFCKNKIIDNYIEKSCSTKRHYDDRFFVSVFKTQSQRKNILKNLLERFFLRYNVSHSPKRKILDCLIEESKEIKRKKKNENECVPITLISVLKLIHSSDELEHVRTETQRLLAHAEEMENVNGNITELMKSVEYLNFFKKIMEILKQLVENNMGDMQEERLNSINKILDNSTLLVESMEEGIAVVEPPEIFTIDDDDEPEFIDSSADTLIRLPNPFSSKFKKPSTKVNVTNKPSQNNRQSVYAANRNNINNEIRVSNRNVGQPYSNINTPPSSSIVTMNTNLHRFNNNPVLNVTTYRETTQMNMSIPILGNAINNQGSYRNVFVNNQQNHPYQGFQNVNSPQHINFSKAFASYASRATSVQQSSVRASPGQQSVRASFIAGRGIPIVLPNTTPRASTSGAAQNSIFNTRLNFRPPVQPSHVATPASFSHVPISRNSQVHNFNNIHGNSLSINQRFQTIRAPFSLNATFPGAYRNSRNLFAGRSNF